MNIWDNKELLEKLEKQREQLRHRQTRMSIDCFNLHIDKQGIFCSYSKTLDISLLGVLGGKLSLTCAVCPLFDTD